MSVFGLPFLLAGIYVVCVSVGIIPLTNAADVPGWAWPVIFVFGLVFASGGNALVVPSKGITVRCRTGLVTCGAGLSDDEIRYVYSSITCVLRGTGRANW